MHVAAVIVISPRAEATQILEQRGGQCLDKRPDIASIKAQVNGRTYGVDWIVTLGDDANVP